MRTEREMFALLRGFALSDERIRAMWLNGSRANPDADRTFSWITTSYAP